MRKFVMCCCLLLVIVLPACSDSPCGDRTKLPPEREVLLHPDSSVFKAVPPDTFRVKLSTSRGDVVIEVVREWSPAGAYRFYNLVRNGFYDGNKFFRMVPGFAAQFGASGYPAVEKIWDARKIPGDPIRVSNTKGMVSFAQLGRETRTTQLFFNLRDNPNLDAQNFAPIGRVVSGWHVVNMLYDEYGDLPPEGEGPAWRCLYSAGNTYLQKFYPQLDSITRATIVTP